MFRIRYDEIAEEDLKNLKKFDRNIVLDSIDEQLSHEPLKKTKNKKILIGVKPPWTQEGPVWELRVGEFRVFYEVNEEKEEVTVHAVKHKPPHLTMEDIL